MIFIPIPQVGKHKRTVCIHQVRGCDFKDIGYQFKISQSLLIESHARAQNVMQIVFVHYTGKFSKHYKEQLVYHNQLVTNIYYNNCVQYKHACSILHL